MQTEAFFTDIRAVIQREISLARHSIHVAVAWFTDPLLFAALLERQRAGVAVALCVVKDDINFRPGHLPFPELAAAGGQFFAVEGALMHHKFCVIDGRDLITGSYNWTLKAAAENQENIVLTTVDHDLAQRFIQQFRTLTGQQPAAAPDANVARVLKRLQVLRGLIQLEEADDLDKQAARLVAESADARLTAIAEALRGRQYAAALRLIDDFIAAYSQLQVWEDPQVLALRLEIRLLETEIVALENEQTEAGRILTAFHIRFTRELGAVLEEVLRLRQELAARHRTESPYSESEYQEARRRYDEQRQRREATEAEAAQTFDLPADTRADLKKLYREASLLCHPDKVAEPHRAAATTAFQQLQEAYRRQDLAAVRALLTNLRRGLFTQDAVKQTDAQLLTARRNALQRKRDTLLNELKNLRAAEAYKLGSDEAAAAAYFADTKAKLEAELTNLRRRYEQQPQPF